jgi:hypothetical protein
MAWCVRSRLTACTHGALRLFCIARKHTQLQDFEAVTAKEHKEVERLVASTCSGQSKKLSEKFRAIEAINAKYQQARVGRVRR